MSFGNSKRDDLAAGAIFFAIGAASLFYAVTQLAVGSAAAMGAGYFPLVLSAALALVGAAIAVHGYLASGPTAPADVSARPVPWRAIALVSLGPILFALTLKGLGLLPSIVLLCVVSGAASRQFDARRAIILVIALTSISVAVFSYGLDLPYPLLGSWLVP